MFQILKSKAWKVCQHYHAAEHKYDVKSAAYVAGSSLLKLQIMTSNIIPMFADVTMATVPWCWHQRPKCARGNTYILAKLSSRSTETAIYTV